MEYETHDTHAMNGRKDLCTMNAPSTMTKDSWNGRCDIYESLPGRPRWDALASRCLQGALRCRHSVCDLSIHPSRRSGASWSGVALHITRFFLIKACISKASISPRLQHRLLVQSPFLRLQLIEIGGLLIVYDAAI